MSRKNHDNEKEYLSGWEEIHSKQENPFNVEIPYEWIVALEAEGQIRGAVLDAGCAAGHNTLFLASKGYDCVGVDISPTAIRRARKKADAQKIQNATFLVANISDKWEYENTFDTVIDIGCFHYLHERYQKRYADVLKGACTQESQIYLRTLNAVNAAGPDPAQTQDR